VRHIRTRKRFKIILVLLFVICLVVFIENRIEDLIPGLKRLVEARVEDALGGRFSFSIGSIGGGIVHPIVLNDIRIKSKGASQFVQSLVIDSIRTNYRTRDIVLAMCGSELPPLLNKNSSAYVNFSFKNGEIKGFVGLNGDLGDSKVDGYLIFFDKNRINFSGLIKDGKFDFEVRPDGIGMGSVRAFGAMSQDNSFTVNFKFDHLKVSGFDVVCDAVLRNEFVKGPDAASPSHVEGALEVENLILNFKPFTSIKADYKLTRDSIEVTGFNIGEVFKAYGRISLASPRDIDLTVLANNVSLSWLALAFGEKEVTPVLTGTLNGKFGFKGPAGKLRMDSSIDIKNGVIGKLDFEYLTATLAGELPFIKIEDSRITRGSGYFVLAGEFDMKRIGKKSMFDDIKLVTDDTAIAWDEWNSTLSGKDAQEFNMKKKIAGQFDFGYKKFVTGDKIGESLRDKDEMHLGYNLQANDSLKVTVSQDKDFFGFEHKDKF